ncbi:OpgC family protein [Salipiger marinus]|uniref:OpgC family protein n=1 Tax=Salipiger marinus TaxID=555512 RepID=UPI004059AF02
MPPPDTKTTPAQAGDAKKLVTFPGVPEGTVRRPRDPRIDAFRGLALVMIFVNHVPGNPYEALTIRNFTFSDAAETFFIMSGIAAGLAYAGRFLPEARARTGLWHGVAPMWGRSWTLYLAHLFLTAWAMAIYAAASGMFGMPELLAQINLRPVFATTEEALFGVAAMTHQLGYVNILPAYTVLLFAGPVLVLLGLWRLGALLALSGLLWFAAGLWRLNLPNFPNEGGWFFNPLSWQLLFVVGLAIGLRLRDGQRLVPRSKPLFALAAGFCLLVLVWKHVPAVAEVLNHQMSRLADLGAPFHLVSHDKTYVAVPRLLNVLALAYVLSCLPMVTAASAHRWAAPLRLLGRQGLIVFCTGTLLSLVLQVIIAGAGEPRWMAWILPPVGVAIMLGIAWLAMPRKPIAPRQGSAQAQGGVVARPAGARAS